MDMHNTNPSAHTEAVLHCISGLMDFYIILSMPGWDKEAASVACRKFCLQYSALRREAEAGGNDLLWRIKPKMHMLQEMVEYQSEVHGNPKVYWTYRDEDFVGWIATIAASRGGPKAGATVCCQVIQRVRAMGVNIGD